MLSSQKISSWKTWKTNVPATQIQGFLINTDFYRLKAKQTTTKTRVLNSSSPYGKGNFQENVNEFPLGRFLPRNLPDTKLSRVSRTHQSPGKFIITRATLYPILELQ